MSPFEAGDKASGQGRARISSLKQKKVETRPEKEYTLNMTKVCLKKFFSLAFVVLFSTNALSEEATEWQASDYVESRLIASHKAVPDAAEGPLYVGWHVRLAENWKTYWRTPGDAGLPPLIDWQGSVNVASAELLYPVPERFEIFDLFTYGYHDEVVYPIRITPAVEGAPVTLNAHIRFLVCDDLCIPEQATFSLTIPASEFGAPVSLNAGLIDKFLAQVPKQDASEAASLKIISVDALGASDKKNLVFRVSGEKLMTGANLIVEDTNGIQFGRPEKRILENPKEAEFIVPMFGSSQEQPMENMPVNVIVSDGWGAAQEFELNALDIEG